MALIKCPECGKEISEYAQACPNCGCPHSLFKQVGENAVSCNKYGIRTDGFYCTEGNNYDEKYTQLCTRFINDNEYHECWARAGETNLDVFNRLLTLTKDDISNDAVKKGIIYGNNGDSSYVARLTRIIGGHEFNSDVDSEYITKVHNDSIEEMFIVLDDITGKARCEKEVIKFVCCK